MPPKRIQMLRASATAVQGILDSLVEEVGIVTGIGRSSAHLHRKTNIFGDNEGVKYSVINIPNLP